MLGRPKVVHTKLSLFLPIKAFHQLSKQAQECSVARREIPFILNSQNGHLYEGETCILQRPWATQCEDTKLGNCCWNLSASLDDNFVGDRGKQLRSYLVMAA